MSCVNITCSSFIRSFLMYSTAYWQFWQLAKRASFCYFTVSVSMQLWNLYAFSIWLNLHCRVDIIWRTCLQRRNQFWQFMLLSFASHFLRWWMLLTKTCVLQMNRRSASANFRNIIRQVASCSVTYDLSVVNGKLDCLTFSISLCQPV